MLLKRLWSLRDAVLAVAGAFLAVFGVFLIYIPAGFIAFGVLLVVLGYVRRALEVMREASSTSG